MRRMEDFLGKFRRDGFFRNGDKREEFGWLQRYVEVEGIWFQCVVDVQLYIYNGIKKCVVVERDRLRMSVDEDWQCYFFFVLGKLCVHG